MTAGPAYDVAIIGGGISGLATLHYLRTRKPKLSVHLFEADTRLGGTIGTDHVDGYSFDWGPNGFLDREPKTLELCEELGLNDTLERANKAVTNRFILRKGKLRPVPMSPPKFMLSGIISPLGKLRIMMEPFSASRNGNIDESVYDFAKRRIGKEAADYLVQPMVSGVYGGVAKKLSLQSCFPIMREMEDEYGSLLKAMFAKAKKARAEGKKSGGPAGPGGWLTSFYGGLYGIIERFQEEYANGITAAKAAISIERDDGNYRVEFVDGSSVTARHVVMATPSYAAAKLVRSLSGELAEALAEIPYAPISVVCFGFKADKVKHDVNGFGFLVPEVEKRRILGSIWTSSIFANRAPAGTVQFRSMIGGDGDHESLELSDDELIEITRKELDDILGIEGNPEVVKLYRWEKGIPQFRIGHSEVLKRIESELQRLGNLHVASNAYHGIGLNDCVKEAHRVAMAINGID